MTPDFQILADSTDITAAIRDRLLSLSVTDAAGIDSDTLEISLDDRDGAIAIPRRGAKLEVRLGYKETGLADLGIYVVDEVGLSGPPDTMTIRGRAADLRAKIKTTRTRPWHKITIGNIVKKIAAEHGYTAKVTPELAKQLIAHIDQTGESDLHFLTRLATNRGAISKAAGGLLLFVFRGQAKSASGKDLPTVFLTGKDLSQRDVTIAERGKYASVVATWHSHSKAKEQRITLGSGEPAYTIRHRYPDEASATAAAKARLEASARGTSTLRFTCPGDVRIGAEGKLEISGCRTGVDGQWVVTTVTHRLDNSGYSCSGEAQSPQAAEEEANAGN